MSQDNTLALCGTDSKRACLFTYFTEDIDKYRFLNGNILDSLRDLFSQSRVNLLMGFGVVLGLIILCNSFHDHDLPALVIVLIINY